MSNSIQVITTPEVTTTDRVVATLTGSVNATAIGLKKQYEGLYRLVFNTPNVEPQAVIDGLGNQAAKLFAVAEGVKTLLLSINPELALTGAPEGVTITANEDGSVTLE